MVYFSDTCTPATDDTTAVAAVWIERIDSEYREMPGLRLTLAQAARLQTPVSLDSSGSAQRIDLLLKDLRRNL